MTVAGVAKSTHNRWEIISSYEYGTESKSDEIPGNNGGPVLIAGWDYRKNLRVECIAAVGVDEDQDNARELFQNLPKFMDQVDIESTLGDSEIAGNVDDNTEWLVKSATKRGVRDGFATATFDLFKTDTNLDIITAS